MTVDEIITGMRIDRKVNILRTELWSNLLKGKEDKKTSKRN